MQICTITDMNTDPSRRYFHELTHQQQVAAVKQMSRQMSEVAIAMATSWSVEYVSHVLGEKVSA